MLSREYFDQVRTSVADLRRAEETVDYWESRISTCGRSSAAPTSATSDPDRITSRISALWAARARAEKAAEGLVEIQDEAIVVIRMIGEQGRAVTALWRDVLLDRFVLGMTIHEVAEKRGRSQSSVRRAIDDALLWVDEGPGIDDLIARARGKIGAE